VAAIKDLGGNEGKKHTIKSRRSELLSRPGAKGSRWTERSLRTSKVKIKDQVYVKDVTGTRREELQNGS